jgi:hypothetical protein
MIVPMARLLYILALLVALALLLYVEWHTDEVTIVLGLLLLLALANGFGRPGAALATGLVLGLAIPLAHFASQASGLYLPRYQLAPPSAGDWITMAALVLPALAAAYAGAWLKRQTRVASP